MPIIFETTFDDANFPTVRATGIHWEQTVDGLSDAVVGQVGDGITGQSDDTTTLGAGEQILSAANNPAGGGGKGQRHWVGDGTNQTSGGLTLQWSGVPELWLRYYIRFQSGFTWGPGDNGGYIKTIYCNVGGVPGTFYFGLNHGVIGGHVEVDDTGGTGNHQSSVTWADWQGGSTGDGLFHCLEVHAKMNTAGALSDGVFEFWLDGTLLYSDSTVHFANTDGATFSATTIGSNSSNPQNGGVDVFVDFDDIVISDSGYIGPIAAASTDSRSVMFLG